jgi:hypothetical protein
MKQFKPYLEYAIPNKHKTNDLNHMVGKVVKSVDKGNIDDDEFWIETTDGWVYCLYHDQDCCECVLIADVDEDPKSIVGGVILSAEEVSSESGYNGTDEFGVDHFESYTYTFYKIETTKGGLWMRWLGESNGYYSESVDFVGVNMEGYSE